MTPAQQRVIDLLKVGNVLKKRDIFAPWAIFPQNSLCRERDVIQIVRPRTVFALRDAGLLQRHSEDTNCYVIKDKPDD